MSEWTDEEVETLRKLWSDGFSFGRIALRIGKSRSAVSGKLDRISAGSRPTINAISFAVSGKSPTNPRRLPKPKQVGLLPVLRDGKQLTLLDLRHNECRYPIDDEAPFHFCGHPGFPYCEFHARLCTQKKVQAS